ncbi:hypothetical protein [Halobacillus salinus]|uniref:hypothetical protein n=1 Tax=Halobacillus salinus TaxID=192814 RepID=UPI0009A56E83|nr:hypothetical protein [Halobacillus salinus]
MKREVFVIPYVITFYIYTGLVGLIVAITALLVIKDFIRKLSLPTRSIFPAVFVFYFGISAIFTSISGIDNVGGILAIDEEGRLLKRLIKDDINRSTIYLIISMISFFCYIHFRNRTISLKQIVKKWIDKLKE